MINFYIILSVIIVSLVSVIGVTALAFNKRFIEKIMLILVSLSAGTLFGDAFLHLLPEAVEKSGFTLTISLTLLAGVVAFFTIEKLIHWNHCPVPVNNHKHTKSHYSHIAPLNIIGDAVHNFMDGLIIAGSYMVSIPVGIATTIAVILHEIPQEMADFGVLLYSGLSKTKAIILNLLSALTAIIGAVIGIILSSFVENITIFLA